MAGTSNLRENIRPAWLGLRRILQPNGKSILLNDQPIRVDPAVSLPGKRVVDYERAFFHAFLAAIPPGGTVLDVGANQGFHTICAARTVGPEGTVVAFEPSPPAVDILRRMIVLNDVADRVHLVTALVGEAHGELMEFHAAPTAVGWASAAYTPPGTHPLLVPTVSIDSVCRSRGLVPSVIKVDVEGLEREVLTGARETLVNHRPPVFCALHPEILEMRGSSPGDVLGFMEGLGYTSATVDGGPVDPDAGTEAVFIHGGTNP